MVVFVCLIIFSHSRGDQAAGNVITTATFVKQNDLVNSVNNNKMSAGNEFEPYPNSVDAMLAGVNKRRNTIEVPQMLEFTSTNLMMAGNQITPQEKDLSRYHVTTSQTNFELNPGQFLPAKVNHYEGELNRPFTDQDNEFWNGQRRQPQVPAPAAPAVCRWNAGPPRLTRSTSSDTCARVPR